MEKWCQMKIALVVYVYLNRKWVRLFWCELRECKTSHTTKIALWQLSYRICIYWDFRSRTHWIYIQHLLFNNNLEKNWLVKNVPRLMHFKWICSIIKWFAISFWLQSNRSDVFTKEFILIFLSFCLAWHKLFTVNIRWQVYVEFYLNALIDCQIFKGQNILKFFWIYEIKEESRQITTFYFPFRKWRPGGLG